MTARQSQLFIPTLREAPADAEAVSHKLLVRGGYIRQVAAGVWTFLPLGWRVHQKVVQIIREEMNAIGGQEMLMPVLTPAELWETTGRNYPEFFMKDSYSFDRDEEGLARSFELHRQAYHRMLERCGLEFYEVEAESGIMGGQEGQGFLCPAG